VVQRSGRVAVAADPALAWSDELVGRVGRAGTVAHAGVVLPRLLADRLGLAVDLAVDLAGGVARPGPRRCGTGAGCWWTPRARWLPGRPR
jgi:hypothetical protein